MRTYRNSDALDERSAEALLGGRLSGHAPDADIASFVAEMRSEYVKPRSVPVRMELAEVFASGVNADRGEVPAADTDPTVQPPSRRRTMLTSLSTFVATLTGKIVLGTAVAAAGVGSAHAAGAVDVPGLPDRPSVVEEAPPDLPDNAGEPDGGAPDSPGVDGSEVADRATSGEPQEDGQSFGESIADEAVEGTPAEDLRDNRGEIADDYRPDTPTGGSGTADDQSDAPSDGTDVADEMTSDGDDGEATDPPGDADTADDYRSTPPTAVD